MSYSIADVASPGVLVCGQETSGLLRGPAFQVFDAAGNLVVTRLVLDVNFITDNQCIGANVDGIAGDEIVIGGREIGGLARGSAFQIWDKEGNLLVGRFVLSPDFTEVEFTVINGEVVVWGLESSGLGRGPRYQIYDGSGNLLVSPFILNVDFKEVEVFGANTMGGVGGEEIVVGGREVTGLERGGAIQVWDKDGNLLWTRLVLNPDFTELRYRRIDIDNDGVDEILVVGRETRGLARGPGFQVWDGSGNLILTRLALNGDFSNVRVFVVDQDGDGDEEIGIGGVETGGLVRGHPLRPARQQPGERRRRGRRRRERGHRRGPLR